MEPRLDNLRLEQVRSVLQGPVTQGFRCHSGLMGRGLEPHPIRGAGAGSCQLSIRGRGGRIPALQTPRRFAPKGGRDLDFLARRGTRCLRHSFCRSVACAVTGLLRDIRGEEARTPGSWEMVSVRSRGSPDGGGARWNRPEPALAGPGPPRDFGSAEQSPPGAARP